MFAKIAECVAARRIVTSVTKRVNYGIPRIRRALGRAKGRVLTEQWLQRWQEGRTGWHEEEGNKSLRKHWRVTGRQVLVPMCGKSPDLKWLADRGNKVIGVELSDLAVEAFFAEQGLEYDVSEDGMRCYRARDAEISIYCGDYFSLTSISCDAHYDRGALIAMSPDLRPRYAAHTSSLLSPDAEQLVISLEYDQQVVKGPPYSVPASEVQSYWPRLRCIDEHDDFPNAPPKFAEAGLTELIEKVWRTD